MGFDEQSLPSPSAGPETVDEKGSQRESANPENAGAKEGEKYEEHSKHFKKTVKKCRLVLPVFLPPSFPPQKIRRRKSS